MSARPRRMPRLPPDEAQFLNREQSWLAFNARVLAQGCAKNVPLLERLKFLAIVSSNFDEFFMIRVAGLMQQRAGRAARRDLTGRSPKEQLLEIHARVHELAKEQQRAIAEVLAKLAEDGLAVLPPEAWSAAQRQAALAHFETSLAPILTPLAVETLSPAPLIPGLRLHVAALLIPRAAANGGGRRRAKLLVIPVPLVTPRFIPLPSDEGHCFALLEDVLLAGLESLFFGSEVLAATLFRLTRDADVAIADDDAFDLVETVERAVRDRRRRAVVRLELSRGADPRIVAWLARQHRLARHEIYETDGVLDATALHELAATRGYAALRYPDWPPQRPRDLAADEDLWEAVQERDVLLAHPYESFEPLVALLERAADEPDVLAIKQVLYRTSGDSPIVRALERAAANGKEVTVLIELKARFDETRNVTWARRLEDVGAHVIYGIAGLKTHAKALLIVARSEGRIRRIVHLATGNYNDTTAKLYSDLGLVTCNREIAADVSAFFNLLTGSSEAIGWSAITIAPTDLRQRFLELIEREIRLSTPEQPGLIAAKVNSLEDEGIIRALYRASQAGVRIRLNVRGICCLRPGVAGLSETIEVCSIVDRFLEHARIFHFHAGGHDEVFLASADWMSRNLDRRLEILFPVRNAELAGRVLGVLETYFTDRQKAYDLRADGSYEPRYAKRGDLRAQERLYRNAVEAAQVAQRTRRRFRPLTAPDT